MVPPGFRRKFTIISGFVSLVQALLYSLAAIYSIAVYKCLASFPSLDITLTSSWELLYETYFNGGNCGANFTDFLLQGIPEPSSTTEIWMIIYSLISSVWIPCCILLIVAAVGKVRGLYGSYLYYPWIVVIAVLIVVDLIATGLHLNDLFQSLDENAYARFVSGNSTVTWQNLKTTGGSLTTYLPALYMTLFFCRGVVFWILNIVMLVLITKACHSVAMYKTRYQQNENITNNTSSQRKWLDVFYQGPDPSLNVERTRFDRNYQLNSIIGGIDSPFQKTIKDSEEDVGPQTKEGEQNQTPDLTKTPQSPQRWTVDEFGIPIEEILPRVNSRRGSLERSSSFQNKGKVFDYLGRPSSFKNMSGSRSPPIRSLEHLPPAELRNQMPFSYFQPMNALPPKPIQRSTNEDAPPVPVPDYTLHFNRNQGAGNKPRVMRKPTEEYFKFPPPLNRSVSDTQGFMPRAQAGVKYVPPVRPSPLAFGVQVFSPNPQSPMPQTPDSILSGSRMLTTENHRR